MTICAVGVQLENAHLGGQYVKKMQGSQAGNRYPPPHSLAPKHIRWQRPLLSTIVLIFSRLQGYALYLVQHRHLTYAPWNWITDRLNNTYDEAHIGFEKVVFLFNPSLQYTKKKKKKKKRKPQNMSSCQI
jgi:hypothetical protein